MMEENNFVFFVQKLFYRKANISVNLFNKKYQKQFKGTEGQKKINYVTSFLLSPP